MKRRDVFILLFVNFIIFVLLLSVSDGFQLTIYDPPIQKANSFARHYNDWIKFLDTDERLREISPYSPEFKERVRDKWKKEGLSNRWKALEKEVQGK